MTEPEKGTRRDVLLRAEWMAVALALVFLVPCVVAIVLTTREGRHRANENRTLIRRLAADEAQLRTVVDRLTNNERAQSTARAANRKKFADSDKRNCLEIEKLKAQVRASVKFDSKEVRLTLHQLNVDPDSPQGRALLERSRAASEKAVKRFKATSCEGLPSVRTSEPKSAPAP